MSRKPLRTESFSQCPLPISQHDTVQLGHGSGGVMMHDLIGRLFRWAFDNPTLNRMDDQAVLALDSNRIAVSTDSFVIDPLFFPGGDIGELAVYGTVNDVAMCGAKPLYLTAGFIIEEGFSLSDLQTIVVSMRDAAHACGVTIVTGDTKVVNKGKGDKLFINTTGIGIIGHDFVISGSNLQPDDVIILSGSIAEHGIAVLSKREGLTFETSIVSDAAPLHELVQVMIAAGGNGIHAMRDPTRGGVAATLNELASSSHVGIRVIEKAVPVQSAVASACGLLGLDPLHVANEGKLIAAVSPASADRVLAAMRAHPRGANAAIIGSVTAADPGRVQLQTILGSWRILDMPVGEQLPRIC
ncbi:hydrogenase expression/formation protein HypE [candidate division GN15 bacterium]|uniref:Hydrogenase expression/formation protein HypE n=1 Tax=candidate division GN15 bacterium TaxID=2072418 RepID=A0A855X4H1_9BACT|nr:MAG: hydrogenase expression/formation protein HypE [candidate division GN15 bacterium]